MLFDFFFLSDIDVPCRDSSATDDTSSINSRLNDNDVVGGPFSIDCEYLLGDEDDIPLS
jgi:hypothetical protein